MSSEPSRRRAPSSKPAERRRSGARRPAPRERSAGGVVVHEGNVLVIVPTRRAADGRSVLALPKGHLDGQETPREAATREVREEAGVVAEVVGELGEVRYTYRRGGRQIAKSVTFYLFRFISGDPADHDDEVQEARWMPLREAATDLSYEGEREMVARALARTEQDR